MKTTVSEFQRNFAKMRERARTGERIIVQERNGAAFTFQLETAPTFATAAKDIIGSYRSGRKTKSLEGYGAC